MATIKPIKVTKKEDVVIILIQKIKIEINNIRIDVKGNYKILVPYKDTAKRVAFGKEIGQYFIGSIYNQSNPQRSGTLSIPLGNTRQVVTIEVKTGKESDDPIGETGLDPANIVPKIVGLWISPENLVKNVKTYIKNSGITTEGKKEINRIIDATLDTKNDIPFDPKKSILTSEFLEALSAIRLCSLLKSESAARKGAASPSSGMRAVFGIPNESVLGDFMIYFPIEKGFPLVDFFVNMYPLSSSRKLPTGNAEKFAGDGILRISVKNITKSPKVNTVKFDLAFGKIKGFKPSPNLAEIWYKSLTPAEKKTEFAQKIIAKESLRGGIDYSKNKKLAPLVSLSELFKRKDYKDKIGKVLSLKYKTGELGKKAGGYINALHSVADGIKESVDTIERTDPLRLLTMWGDYVTPEELALITEFLSINFTTKNKVGKPANFETLTYAGDKIFEWATDVRDPEPKWNFYRLFYDQVLTARGVVYGITSSKNKVLKYDFYSKNNYKQEYHSWIGLRSKGTDQLGMG